MDCSLPGLSVHWILQDRNPKWVAIPFSRGSSWSRDWNWFYCIGREILYWSDSLLIPWSSREALVFPLHFFKYDKNFNWNIGPFYLASPIQYQVCEISQFSWCANSLFSLLGDIYYTSISWWICSFFSLWRFGLFPILSIFKMLFWTFLSLGAQNLHFCWLCTQQGGFWFIQLLYSTLTVLSGFCKRVKYLHFQ